MIKACYHQELLQKSQDCFSFYESIITMNTDYLDTTNIQLITKGDNILPYAIMIIINSDNIIIYTFTTSEVILLN